MIRAEKYTQALTALQQIIIRARFLAYKEEDHSKIAELLDWAEYLPQLIIATEDRTESYAAVLKDISEKHPYCYGIFLEFSREPGQPSAATAA
jgi:hypothetical protein